jgi:nucleotide-binding universal stress UspA family protein
MAWTIDPNREQLVLLPFDFSDAASEAISTAVGLVARIELLWVLHVVPPIEISSPGFQFGGLSSESLRDHADTALAEALAKAGVRNANRRVVAGDPATEIITTAKELGANLIVIPSRGKSGIRRWMIGSVAERVVRKAPCPVLVLPIFSANGSDDEDHED